MNFSCSIDMTPAYSFASMYAFLKPQHTSWYTVQCPPIIILRMIQYTATSKWFEYVDILLSHYKEIHTRNPVIPPCWLVFRLISMTSAKVRHACRERNVDTTLSWFGPRLPILDARLLFASEIVLRVYTRDNLAETCSSFSQILYGNGRTLVACMYGPAGNHVWVNTIS